MAIDLTPGSRFRSPSFAVLCGGTVLALGLALASGWWLRAGLVVALLTAATVLVLTWREMDRVVAEHAAEVAELRAEAKLARDQARAAAHRHHEESMAMIERFNQRQAALRSQITAGQQQAVKLQTELAASGREAQAKQNRIAALNRTIAQLQKEMHEAEQRPTSLPRERATRRLS